MSQHKVKLVLFNAPPNAGKDTCSDFLVDHGYSHIRFKDSLYHITAELFGFDQDEFFTLASGRDTKEVPVYDTGYGKILSPRQMMIQTSESIIKPYFGNKYFGKRLLNTVNRLVQQDKNLGFDETKITISDCGFKDEIQALYDGLWDDDSPLSVDMTIVRISKSGCTFEGDSRNYVYMNNNCIKEVSIKNDGTLDDLYEKVISIAHEGV